MLRLRARVALPAFVLPLLAAVAPAQAATVSLSGGTLRVVAAPGEANALAVSTASGTVAVTDAGKLSLSGAGCSLPLLTRATCPSGSVQRLELVGGDGDDVLTVSVALPAKLDGGEGDDRLTGGTKDDVLTGGPGADRLAGGDGRDAVDYTGRTAPLDVDLAAGTGGEAGEGDQLLAVESVTGGDGADVLRGGPTAGTLAGGDGDDVLDGRGGADRLEGGTGFDTADYTARTSNVAADADGSADDGQSGEADDVRPDVERIVGGAGDDRLTGADAVANTLEGGAGDDDLDGRGGDDVLLGGDGDDQAWGGSGQDLLDGAAGADELRTGSGDDEARGGDGADRLHGEDDRDLLDGGAGADKLWGGKGDDRLDGGTEADELRGETGDDALEGGEGDDRLEGAEGADALHGAGGADRLLGGSGDDRLDGGLGPDVLEGHDGQDTADYAWRTAGVRVDLDGVADDGERGEGDDVRATVDDVLGGAGDDLLEGSSWSQVLDGGAGDDQLRGLGGDDRLRGGPGRDLLVGGDGKDDLDGGDGADHLSAADKSADRLACGAGRDVGARDKLDTALLCERAGIPALARATVTKVVRSRARKGFASLPENKQLKVDRRILQDVRYLVARFDVQVVTAKTRRARKGDPGHTNGVAIDVTPAAEGSWAEVDALAAWVRTASGRPRRPFAAMAYRRGAALHLSWRAAKAKRGRTARWVDRLVLQAGK